MFGVGMPELLVIFVVALIVLGPKRLPEVARQLGKAMAEFRRQSADVMEEFQSQLRLDDEPPRRAPAKPQAVAAAKPAAPTPATATPAAAEPEPRKSET
jgi:Tat protein translocase TatB subunit